MATGVGNFSLFGANRNEVSSFTGELYVKLTSENAEAYKSIGYAKHHRGCTWGKNSESYCSQWKSYCDVQSWENDERCTIYCSSSKYFPDDAESREGVTVADSIPSDLLNANF